MTNCPHNPAHVWHGDAVVLRNERLADDTYFISMKTTAPFPATVPGQFVMLKLPYRADPLLGRPLAIYNRSGDTPDILDIVYIVVGKMTSRLQEVKPGETLNVWGPLGNGFSETQMSGNVLCVAGGIGHTPFLTVAQKAIAKGGDVTLLYGAKTKSRISCMDDFRALGVNVQVATEDGSEGRRGFVTELIEQNAPNTKIILSCGPTPMLKAVVREAGKLSLPCFVSLESPMACGLGICYSCVVDYRTSEEGETPEQWDYRRCCVDGPVFDAYRIKL